MSSVKPQWEAGVEAEVDFWRSVLRGDNPAFLAELKQRLNPETPIMANVAALFPPSVAPENVSIVDVGAGPVSCVGWQVNGARPKIMPIDALAMHYRELLEEFSMEPPAWTEACDGEEIVARLAPESFDIVHCRNALDHCYDAIAVMRGMLTVLKPGGALLIYGYTDEAEFENYSGLHQWNIRAKSNDMLIWRPGTHFSVMQTFGDQIERIEADQDEAARWTSVTIWKRRTH